MYGKTSLDPVLRRFDPFLTDDDAWLTMHRTFKLSDYMSDDYSYREGRTWGNGPS
jgi:hypothetical protein